MTFILSFILNILMFIPILTASPQSPEKETEIAPSASTRLKLPAAWSYDAAAGKLTAPEGDLHVYLIEKPSDRSPEDLSAQAWQKVEKGFKLRIQLKLSPPPKKGWDEIHDIYYETPARDNRIAVSQIRIFKGQAYIILVNGSVATASKRGSQLQIISDTWRPNSLKKEDLSSHKAKAWTQADARELDAFVAKAMETLNLPGVSVGVVQAGKLVYSKGFGVKRLGEKENVTPQTLFMIGSTAKPLTTLMLAKLVENGRLSWETPLQKILPDFKLADQEAAAKFLLKHTACACTGMPRRDLEFVLGSLTRSPQDTLQQLGSLRPTTGFGETFQYSNHLVAAGGMAGAVVHGKGSDLLTKYENAMTDLVFEPLGMKNTKVKPRPTDLGLLASPHARDFNGRMVAIPEKLEDMVYPVAPAGAVWSNVEDMARYIMMELRNGKGQKGETLFSETQIQARRTPGVKVDDDSHYGLGLFIEKDRGITIMSHGGNTLGFTHDLFFLPDHDFGMVVQTNAGDVNGLRTSLKQKLLELVMGASPQSEKLLDYAKNVYRSVREQAHAQISNKPADTKWISSFLGHYESRELGRLTLLKKGSQYWAQTDRWESPVASMKDPGGVTMIALTGAPWSGHFAMQAHSKPTQKLIITDSQMTYEYLPEGKRTDRLRP